MAGMSSIDAGIGLSYHLDDKKYDSQKSEKEDGTLSSKKEENEAKVNEDSRADDIALTVRLHYIYTYNENDSFELFLAPSLQHDFAEEGETSLQYNNIQGSFFKEITGKWGIFGKETFSLKKNGNEENTIGEDMQTKSEEENPADKDSPRISTSELSEETHNIRYYKNKISLGTRYLYGERNSLQFVSSYDLLREDSNREKNKSNDYDRYAFYIENRHRFNSKWGTTLRGGYVRGQYEDETIQQVASVKDKEEDQTIRREPTPAEKEVVSGDVSEYQFSGSISNYFSPESTFILEYDYTKAVYDTKALGGSTIFSSMLRWNYRFSNVLQGSLGIGPAWRERQENDNLGLNGLAELRYQQKRSNYAIQFSKTSDMENFDGTDNRGAIERLSYRINSTHQLSRDLTLRGAVEYGEDKGETITPSTTEKEPAFISEEYEKRRWLATVGLQYRLQEDIDTQISYTFSHLDADTRENSYDEHQLYISVDWNQEWLRW